MKRTVTIEVSNEEVVKEIVSLGIREAMSLILAILHPLKSRNSWPLYLAAIDSEEGILLVADGGDHWVKDASLCQFGACSDCKVKSPTQLS